MPNFLAVFAVVRGRSYNQTAGYLGVLSVFVQPDSSMLFMFLLVVTTLGISAAFWILFVYVHQISVVRNRRRQAGRWVSRLLGTVLIALGIRLWFSEAPG